MYEDLATHPKFISAPLCSCLDKVLWKQVWQNVLGNRFCDRLHIYIVNYWTSVLNLWLPEYIIMKYKKNYKLFYSNLIWIRYIESCLIYINNLLIIFSDSHSYEYFRFKALKFLITFSVYIFISFWFWNFDDQKIYEIIYELGIYVIYIMSSKEIICWWFLNCRVRWRCEDKNTCQSIYLSNVRVIIITLPYRV